MIGLQRILIAGGATLALLAAAAAFACTGPAEPPAPVPPPAPTAAPTPAPTPTATPMPTATPTPAPTPTPTVTPIPTPIPTPSPLLFFIDGARLIDDAPDAASAIESLPWITDGVDGTETPPLELLIAIASESPELASALASAQWVQDEVAEGEIADLESMLFVAESDAGLAASVASLGWVLAGISPLESQALRWFGVLARFDASTAVSLTELQWVQNGIAEMEAEALKLAISIADPGARSAVVALGWVQDGIDEAELTAIEGLASSAETHGNVTVSLAALHWVQDGVEEAEAEALVRLGAIGNAELAAAVVALAWVQDDVSALEAEAIRLLGNLDSAEAAIAAVNHIWMQDSVEDLDLEALQLFFELALISPEVAALLLSMPFIETLTPLDILAVEALWDYAGPSREFVSRNFAPLSRLNYDWDKVLALHPVQSGITDDVTPVLVTLPGVFILSPGLVPTLLDPTKTSVEHRTVTTPLAVEVELAIVRSQQGAANTMDYLEHAVLTAEDLVGAPFPIHAVVLLYADLGLSGVNSGTFINIPPEGNLVYGLGQAITHEVAHYYWTGNASWVDEGLASVMSALALERLAVRPLDLWEAPCPYARTIAEFEALASGLGTPAFVCRYSLGERLFLDLYHSLGEERFRQGLRSLYLASPQGGGTRVGSVRNIAEAFGADDETVQTVIARWYDGSAPYDLSRLDMSPVDPALPGVNGRVTDAYVAVDGGESSAATFTAGSYSGLALVLESAGDAHEPVDLEVVEYYEDGFGFARHTLTLAVSPDNTGATGKVRLRIGGEAPPGAYWVYVYDGDRKVAEVQYTITA